MAANTAHDNNESVKTKLRSIYEVVVGSTLAKSTTTTLTSASNAITMDCSLSDDFLNTPTETTTITPTNIQPNQFVTIRFLTSGTQTYTSTFASPIVSTGTLASGGTTAKTFMVAFKANAAGTALYEVSRTVAM